MDNVNCKFPKEGITFSSMFSVVKYTPAIIKSTCNLLEKYGKKYMCM